MDRCDLIGQDTSVLSFTVSISDETHRARGLAVALQHLDALVIVRECLGKQSGGVPNGSPEFVS